jgi:tetratricopeptide (TPR) repeat protein
MLAEPEPEAARAALDRLVEAQLVEPVADGRYQLHDLVRLLAAERAESEDPPEACEEAVVRAVSYYTGANFHATEKIHCRSPTFSDPEVPEGLALPTFAETQDSRTWVDSEVDNLVAALEQATASSECMDPLTLRLAFDLWTTLDMRCEWHTARRLGRLVLDTGMRHSASHLVACGHLLLGRSEASIGSYDRALHHLEQACGIFQELDNPPGMAVVLNGLGVVNARRQDHVRALSYFEGALVLAERHDLVTLASSIMTNSGASLAALGQYDRASDTAEKGIAIGARVGSTSSVASSLINLSIVRCLQGSHEDALRYVDLAIPLHREVGDRMRECESLVVRSAVYLGLGRVADAESDAEGALVLALATGYPYAGAAALTQRSRILACRGDTIGAASAQAEAAEVNSGRVGTFRDPLLELLVAPTDPTAACELPCVKPHV